MNNFISVGESGLFGAMPTLVVGMCGGAPRFTCPRQAWAWRPDFPHKNKLPPVKIGRREAGAKVGGRRGFREETRGTDGFCARIHPLGMWSAKRNHAAAWQSTELFQHKANLHPTNAGPMVVAGAEPKRGGSGRTANIRRPLFGKICAEEESRQTLENRHEEVHRSISLCWVVLAA